MKFDWYGCVIGLPKYADETICGYLFMAGETAVEDVTSTARSSRSMTTRPSRTLPQEQVLRVVHAPFNPPGRSLIKPMHVQYQNKKECDHIKTENKNLVKFDWYGCVIGVINTVIGGYLFMAEKTAVEDVVGSDVLKNACSLSGRIDLEAPQLSCPRMSLAELLQGQSDCGEVSG